MRGVAVVAMVFYHLSYDLAYFVGLFDVGFFRQGAGLDIARVIGGTFTFLAGLSLTLSYARAPEPSGWRASLKYLGRGARIFSYGLIITLLTWIFVPRDMIFFGILHMIGASIILAYPFLKLKLMNVLLGAGCIVLGVYLRQSSVVESPWLAWLGGRPGFSTLDYWPIFPWFGVMLLGIAAGNALYGSASKRTSRSTPTPLRPLTFLGSHSLAVYLIHQPVLIAALALLGLVEMP